MRRLAGGLFWKLLLALWLSMALSIAGSITYYEMFGRPSRSERPPGTGTTATLRARPRIPVVPLVSGGIAILIVATGMAWTLSRPLKQLRSAVQRLGEGHYDTRVSAGVGRRRDEIGDLGAEFDRMAERLQQLTEARQVLFHDVSHELRSPLARMQAVIGLLQQSPEQAPALVDRLARETERLDALVGELMTLHRLDGAATPALRDTVDVIELLQAIVEDAGFEAQAAGKRLTVRVDARFVARVDGELVYRAIENVLRNAIAHAPAGSEIEVDARLDEAGALCIAIADRGPGVPEDMLRRIFEPFVRVDNGEGEGRRGTGLGLAIAQRALTAHGGSIDASLRPGGGLCVRLRLPRGSAAA